VPGAPRRGLAAQNLNFARADFLALWIHARVATLCTPFLSVLESSHLCSHLCDKHKFLYGLYMSMLFQKSDGPSIGEPVSLAQSIDGIDAFVVS
jgi:hypothetical protein